MNPDQLEKSPTEGEATAAAAGEREIFRAKDVEKDHVSTSFYVVGYFFLALPAVTALWYLLQMEFQASMVLASGLCGAILAVCTWMIVRFVRRSYNRRYGFSMHASADRLIMLRAGTRREHPFSSMESLQFIGFKEAHHNLTRLGLARGRKLVFKGDPLAAESFNALSGLIRSSVVENLEGRLAKGSRVHFQEPVLKRIYFLILGLGLLSFALLISVRYIQDYALADVRPNEFPPIHIPILFAIGALVNLFQFWFLQRGGLFADRRGVYRRGLFRREALPWTEVGGVIRLGDELAVKDTRGRERLSLTRQAKNAFVLEELIERMLRSP